MTDSPTPSLTEMLRRAKELDAPVAERLALYASAQRRLAAPYSAAVDRLVARLQSVSAGRNAPNPGDVLPDFLLPDEHGHLVGLGDILKEGPAVIAFHRGHWCPFCRINAHALMDIEQQVRARGGQIVAITPERGHFTSQHRADAGASYRILSDIENAYALSLDLAVWVDDDVRSHLLGFGRDLTLYHGSSGWILPIPATFIVGRDRKIITRFIDPDHRHRMALDDILSAIGTAP